MSKRPTDMDQARFLKDVAQHQVTIVHDQPEKQLRVVRFGRPGSSTYMFTLTTWPGYLAYTGDMGTYVFSRERDMFPFFRQPPEDLPEGADLTLRVNPSYWSEKVQAASTSDGVKVFRIDLFKAAIERWLDDMEAAPELREAVAEDMPADLTDYDSSAAYHWAMDFEDVGGRHVFQDFYEVDCSEYSGRFMWCCYALIWGIDQYDRAKDAGAAAEHVQV